MKYSRLVVTLLLIGSFACAKVEKGHEEVQAAEQERVVEAQAKVYLKLDVEKLSSLKSGDELVFTLESGSMHTLKIQGMEETMPGIMAISSYIDDLETGQATLILRDGKLAGSVNMYSEGVSYKVGFDEGSGSHYLVPINPDERDVLQGGEPKTVPSGNQ
ncbi:MAG: hypothetical protein BalsKO_27450 [Balneolaceae bacterium]